MAGTAISDIMEATEMAKGGIYGNFTSKEEICLEAFDYLAKGLYRRLDQVIESQNTAKDKLYALLDYYVERLVYSDTGGCPLLNFGTEADDTNPAIKQKVNEAINAIQKKISQLVTEGKRKGEFNSEVNARAFALKTLAIIEGGMFIGRVQNSNSALKQLTAMLKAEIAAF